MTIKEVLLKPIKLIGGGLLNLRGFNKGVINEEIDISKEINAAVEQRLQDLFSFKTEEDFLLYVTRGVHNNINDIISVESPDISPDTNLINDGCTLFFGDVNIQLSVQINSSNIIFSNGKSLSDYLNTYENFYVKIGDDTYYKIYYIAVDNPSIGIRLCGYKNNTLFSTDINRSAFYIDNGYITDISTNPYNGGL